MDGHLIAGHAALQDDPSVTGALVMRPDLLGLS
jgi:hypothetical protein